MTSPVTAAAAPAARPPAGTPAGSDSAGPFASALDGAMSHPGAAGRTEADVPGRDGEQPGPGQDGATDGPADGATDETADGAAPGVVAVPGAGTAAPGGLVAALWARLTGTPAADGSAAGGTPPADPGATGRAHASATAPGLALGLRGSPGQVPAGGPAAPHPAAAPAGPPAAAGPVLPPPASATADAAAVLAGVGVELVVAAPAGGSTGAAAPAAVQIPAAPAAGAPVPLPAATGDAPGAPGSAGSAVPDGGTVLPVAGPPSGTSTGSGAEGGRADGAPAESSPVVGASAAPAASPVAPAPRAEAAGTGPAVAPPVAGQLARSVAVLRGGPDGTHTMTVVLTPENLGPVEVSVTLSQGTLELTLRGAHDHGRAALVDALPELRRDLEAAGLTCSRLDVDRGGRDGASTSQSSAQQAGGRDGGGGRGQQHDRGGEGARPWHRPADNGVGHPARVRTASGLDVRV